jgi:hypothetical protein
MSGLSIWLGAGVLYGLFRAWYDNWRGPLRPEEIERFLAAMPSMPGAGGNDAETLRRFLEADDGREFYMLNLVRLADDAVPHPKTGAPTKPMALLREYFRSFVSVLARHAGHPALQARKIGGYVDAWSVPPDPGWSIVGMVRYRSRRDMIELASDPRFLAAHPFKISAIPVTASFPTKPGFVLVFGPRVWVALLLGLGAALLT